MSFRPVKVFIATLSGTTASGRAAPLSTGCDLLFSGDLTEPVALRQVFFHKNSVKYYLDHQAAKRQNFHISSAYLPCWRCLNPAARRHSGSSAGTRETTSSRGPEAASLGFG